MSDKKDAKQLADSKAAKKPAADQQIYHEKQSLQRCGVHTANNLLQSPTFTTAGMYCYRTQVPSALIVSVFPSFPSPFPSCTDFDAICYKLNPNSLINPHKSILGTGNYDVNVLVLAFQQVGAGELKWFDRRRALSEIDWNRITGIIVNEKKPAVRVVLRQREREEEGL